MHTKRLMILSLIGLIIVGVTIFSFPRYAVPPTAPPLHYLRLDEELTVDSSLSEGMKVRVTIVCETDDGEDKYETPFATYLGSRTDAGQDTKVVRDPTFASNRIVELSFWGGPVLDPFEEKCSITSLEKSSEQPGYTHESTFDH